MSLVAVSAIIQLINNTSLHDIVYQIVHYLSEVDRTSFIYTCRSATNLWKRIISYMPMISNAIRMSKISHHKYLHTFDYSRANDHMSFILAAYRGDLSVVGNYLNIVKDSYNYDLVQYDMFNQLSSDFVPLSAHSLCESIIKYIDSVTKVEPVISSIRLACHAASKGNQHKVFLRLLNVLYPNFNLCGNKEAVFPGDYDIWPHEFSWDFNIGFRHALENNNLDALKYFYDSSLFIPDIVSITAISEKGYIKFLDKFLNKSDVHHINISPLIAASVRGNLSINRRVITLNWWLNRYGKKLDGLIMVPCANILFLAMYLSADEKIVNWWSDSGLFSVYIIIGDLFKYFKNYSTKDRLHPIKSTYDKVLSFSPEDGTFLQVSEGKNHIKFMYMSAADFVYDTNITSIVSFDLVDSSLDPTIERAILENSNEIYKTIDYWGNAANPNKKKGYINFYYKNI